MRVRASVLRDGRPHLLPLEHVVPGDVVLLSAGSLVPADSIVLDATDCFVSQAVLTGESFPVEKKPGLAPASASLAARGNCVYMGTNVRSGTARCLVVRTGAATEFGTIAHRLTLRPPETEFDRGLRHFGYLLTSAVSMMVLLVFVAHVFMGRPPIETLLFAVALAVGLSPELLPAILSVSLAHCAQMMARHGVLVRRLTAIENLGSVDILCTDKTGTLTEGVVQLEGAYDAYGAPAPEVLDLAACNAALETGIASPLDEAILRARTADLGRVRKIAEIPFDFVRKRVTVVVHDPKGVRLITKGATRASQGREPVDVAREAADFVLLERSLDVIRRGIEEGRRTFANTLKYILITTSANLGNMVSMATVSLYLPFLPLTAGQILLNNFLSDVPAVGLADDSVDPELVDRPRRWDIWFVGRYMLEFGILSSGFDFLTFGVLLFVFRASVETFRTSWFVESLLTELVIALVVRTRRPFFRSRPGAVLLVSTAGLIALPFAIPYLPFAAGLGFVPLPVTLLVAIATIAALSVVATELLKKWFYRKSGESQPRATAIRAAAA